MLFRKSWRSTQAAPSAPATTPAATTARWGGFQGAVDEMKEAAN
jgi:hypothetical protein